VVAVAAAALDRIRREIVALAGRGLGVHGFTRAATAALAKAVPYEGRCMMLLDPATLLPTAEFIEHGLPAAALARLQEIELQERDVNAFTALARQAVPVASLSAATGGDLDRSMRHRELRRPSGFADELRAVLRDGTGVWGGLTLLRESGSPAFSPVDVRFVASVVGPLADGIRRGMLRERETDERASDETGVLVLGRGGDVELANQAAEWWLDRMWAHDRPGLPVVIRSVVSRVRSGGSSAVARVRTRTGHWVVVRGSLLGAGAGSRVAVLLEAARPELAPLLADVFGLTQRERLVTELVAQGLSTNDIAERLRLSAYTVQDHLKSVFDKTGTSSRGALVARIFFDHYAPRLAVSDTQDSGIEALGHAPHAGGHG
jgi:DNA-binding CsgD family transcriptional regulator